MPYHNPTTRSLQALSLVTSLRVAPCTSKTLRSPMRNNAEECRIAGTMVENATAGTSRLKSSHFAFRKRRDLQFKRELGETGLRSRRPWFSQQTFAPLLTLRECRDLRWKRSEGVQFNAKWVGRRDILVGKVIEIRARSFLYVGNLHGQSKAVRIPRVSESLRLPIRRIRRGFNAK